MSLLPLLPVEIEVYLNGDGSVDFADLCGDFLDTAHALDPSFERCPEKEQKNNVTLHARSDTNP